MPPARVRSITPECRLFFRAAQAMNRAKQTTKIAIGKIAPTSTLPR